MGDTQRLQEVLNSSIRLVTGVRKYIINSQNHGFQNRSNAAVGLITCKYVIINAPKHGFQNISNLVYICLILINQLSIKNTTVPNQNHM